MEHIEHNSSSVHHGTDPAMHDGQESHGSHDHHAMMTLIASAIVVMLLGHWIEMRSVMGASRAQDELVKWMIIKGLLIRNRAAFENARKTNVVIFDKTGTLTEGQFGATDISAIGISEDELLAIDYAIESNSEHPIAKDIVKEAKKRGITLKTVTDFERLSGEGETVTYILADGILLGAIALSDIVRESAGPAVDALRTIDIESYLVTGDNLIAWCFGWKVLRIKA